MKKSIIILLHLGYWFCYLVLACVILGLVDMSGDMNETRVEYFAKVIIVFALAPSLFSFYSFYFYIFPYCLKFKYNLKAISLGLLISLLISILFYYVLNVTIAKDCRAESGTLLMDIEAICFMWFIATINGVIAVVMQGFITWFDEIKLKEELKQKNYEMEMALVKSQLDPHFLFNTLNNIDVLILRDPVEGSNYLNKLSDIMRFMLYEIKTDKIPLSKELQYIDKYIELQKIRSANLSYVNYNVTGVVHNQMIAPMLFIPFIENAFKHTNNKKVDNAITINIEIKDSSIVFMCENKFSATVKNDNSDNGLGNDLIKKRLNLMYPSNHILITTNQNDTYTVHLTINHG